MAFLSLLLFFFFSLLAIVRSQPSPPKGTLIDCGATIPSVIDGQQWLSDNDFVSAGIPKTLHDPNPLPILQTVRSFPLGDGSPKKFCYVVPVIRNSKYLVRTTYFYGGINGRDLPPVFDQIIDGTRWSIVNTTEDFTRGMPSYYEGVFLARVKTMSVCVARNTYTDSDPFISALEFILLGSSVYNSTDFANYGLNLVARNSFGYGGPMIRFPDDPFDRYWEPFGESNTTTRSTENISVSGFWNLPPLKVFETALTTDQSKPMKIELQWPPISLPNSIYYIAMYFADDRNSLLDSSRIFNITMNGVEYFRNLNVTTAGVVVFASRWPLSGLTNITLLPAEGSVVGPLINAGEIFNVLLLGGKTHTRDVISLDRVKSSLRNPPPDWKGDPCLPRQYAWTGVTCSEESEGPRIRVVALNLSSMALSGSISPGIAKLTALTNIWLGNNNLTGSIPDLSSLRMLETLHLENNQLSGVIPPSLGAIESLRELFVQNNNLTGQVPSSLLVKPDLNLKMSPGNNFLPSQPPPTT
ncbi:Leucine-rich repeat [Macleaya cordata]|uniref:Leucine-rich repeat n=1 Tax=Macleaya cordata TaxID=56857 RepID=A0A200Q4R9_MACCD|nr:Leucine-rich repeat [Macleaya cordata]